MTHPEPLAGAMPVLVVMSDLLFRSKIDEVARRLGLPLRAAKSLEQLDRQLAAAPPSIAFIDLEADSFDPGAAIRRIIETVPGTRIMGFAGHSNVAAIRLGRDAGASDVLARSAFTDRLPQVLQSVLQAEQDRIAATPTP